MDILTLVKKFKTSNKILFQLVNCMCSTYQRDAYPASHYKHTRKPGAVSGSRCNIQWVSQGSGVARNWEPRPLHKTRGRLGSSQSCAVSQQSAGPLAKCLCTQSHSHLGPDNCDGWSCRWPRTTLRTQISSRVSQTQASCACRWCRVAEPWGLVSSWTQLVEHLTSFPWAPLSHGGDCGTPCVWFLSMEMTTSSPQPPSSSPSPEQQLSVAPTGISLLKPNHGLQLLIKSIFMKKNTTLEMFSYNKAPSFSRLQV